MASHRHCHERSAVWRLGTALLLLGVITPGRGLADIVFSAPLPLNETAASDGTATDTSCHILGNDMGQWVAVWVSDNSLGATIGTDTDILYAYSSDSGATWSAPAPIHSYAQTDNAADGHPWLANDGGNNWVCVWQSNANMGGIGTDTDILVAHSTNAGQNWSAPTALNSHATSDAAPDEYPRIVTDKQGRWVCVWSSTVPLVDGENVGPDADILASRSTDNGNTWSTARKVNMSATTDTGFDQRPAIAFSGTDWVVAWESYETFPGTLELDEDTDILVARSSNANPLFWAISWIAQTPLNSLAASDTGDDLSPDIAVDGYGRLIAAWQSQEDMGGAGTDMDIFFARSTDHGATWTSQVILNSTATTDGSAYDVSVRLAADRASAWVAVWSSTATLGGQILDDPDVLMTSSTNGGLSWTAARPLHTSAYTDTPIDHDYAPVVAVDNRGRWIGAWTSTNAFEGTLTPSIGTDPDLLFARFVPPFVESITPTSPSPTNAATVTYNVVFSEIVTGVDVMDFVLDAHNLAGESVASVFGGGANYTVTVNTGNGCGTLRLDLVDDDSILSGGGIPLGGPGLRNGDFTEAATYVIARQAPTITLLGDNPLHLECGRGAYELPGVVATDCLDGDISDQVVVTGDLDTDTPGEYALEYNVSNSMGEPATPVTRVVIVYDTIEIALVGANPLSWPCGVPYVDPGAIAEDHCPPEPTLEIDASGVNVNLAGIYTVFITASETG
ncbi:MAG TPA: DUF5011 domain-containing protein, partial [Candidatus Hydrogenedentes bacterium]|nr:DUF5011 domain-containing protein [Candidatus Hydrogenedentota bacterium]